MVLLPRELPKPVQDLAAKALMQDRRRGDGRHQVLPDFFIEAHAAMEAWALLTRDAGRFGTCFPTPKVIEP